MRFLNMKTDYAFKKVFGSQNSKGILNSVLNSTLDLPSPIEDLTIEDPYNVPKLKGMKETAVDVKATLEDKTKVIVEMQILNHDSFESRILYNTAKNYANQLDKGAKYNLLNPVIALTIVNFKMFKFDKYKSIFKLLEKENFTEFIFMQKSSIEKGTREGYENGEKQGREEGEYNKALEIVKNLKASGMDAQAISDITGLSVEAIDGV